MSFVVSESTLIAFVTVSNGVITHFTHELLYDNDQYHDYLNCIHIPAMHIRERETESE